MSSAEDAGDNPLRLANEIDAALAKYGLATITACARRSTFLRANYASSLNACALCWPAEGRKATARQHKASIHIRGVPNTGAQHSTALKKPSQKSEAS